MTKQLEKEVLNAYHHYWNSYISGDIDAMATVLHDDCHVFGSTLHEVFTDKQSALAYYQATADQISNKVEFRNKKIELQPIDGNIMVLEQLDLYLLIDAEWTFYGHGRLSTLLIKTKGGWQVIHQHGSLPDGKAEEGEQVAAEKIRDENLQLKEAIKRRTVELENKNRELEIEASLEKVRARTMAMHNTSELQGVIHAVHKELLNLNIAISGGSFIVVNSEIDKELRCWGSGGTANTSEEVNIPLYKKPFCTNLINRIKNGPRFFTEEYTQQEKRDFFTFLLKHEPWSKLDVIKKNETISSPGGYTRSCCVSAHTSIFIVNHFGEKFTEADNEILQRFGKVFEQTYTRFLDLQKAEAQAMEAQIEAALERIRSASMAMHSSEQLAEVIKTVTDQLLVLGFSFETANFITNFTDKGFNLWLSVPGVAHPSFIYVPYDDNVFFRFLQQGVVLKKEFDTLTGGKEEKNKFFKHFFTKSDTGNIPDERKKYVFDKPGVGFTTAFRKHFFFTIVNYEGRLHSSEENTILNRFANVFEQSYTRFLDLQKAEAQAREALIEAGLERVRYSAMAMQSSEDVGSATAVMFNEISGLGVEAMRCGITIIHPDKTADVWAATTTNEGKEMKGMGTINFNNHPLWVGLFDAWNNKEENYAYDLKGDDLKSYYTILTHSPNYNSSYIQGQEFPEHTFYASFFDQGAVFTFSLQPYTDDKRRVLKRFTAVFSLTFRRYLDLKQAEAQAREAQIEAALERVRARTMAMHMSNDLLHVISVLSEQFQLLGFKIDSANFNTSYREKDWNLWLYNPGIPLYPDQIRIPYFDHPFFNRTIEGLAQGKDFNAFVFSKEEKDSFLDHLYSNTIAKNHVSEERKKYCYDKPGFAWSVGYLENTAITIANYDAEPYTEEQNSILRRFGNVFEQSYRRFLDLQKAEAQAREAEIQLALERVRARTMAMQRSEELAETCELLFEEFRKLHIVKSDQVGTAADRTTIGIFNEVERTYDLSITNLEGKKLDHTFHLSLDEPINIAKVYAAWKEGNPLLVIDMHANDLNQWFNYLRSLGLVIDPDLYNKRRVNTFAFFSKGTLGTTTNEPLPEESLQLLQRFADTFNLTYTRFQELKDAEARTEIAIKEASLDRVRGEIASMRTAEDLKSITPLVWRELTALGVPFFRCGVFIVDEEKQKIHFYLSSPDGKPLAALELDFHATPTTQNATTHWREQKVYISHWSKEEFLQYAQNLISQGQIQNLHTYQGGDKAPESLTLQFVPFAQGMMYVGSAEDLSAAQIELVQSLADAFSTAYARYEDFTKLEAAKQQVESTLKDLRATQTQLIQSEKMASLGELTAGIAHEIQNPLNFVNNFSEVSTELVDEMNEEIKKGNLEDAQQIAADLKENLSKINHHGKRAGDIVKGMLQHSRSSSGIKEPTDINALADEYLRLAYHGLRAKDKSFNATMITDFDDSIGMINVIPQDMGRVILNLITNAFYAVNTPHTPRPPEGGADIATKKYEPTVTISTSFITPPSGGRGVDGRKVIISVKDNGPGISQNIVEKIFQPFFTTKPTGQGTGLGLSLSYDIVKAHGGELKVETKEGAGTSFHILLPA